MKNRVSMFFLFISLTTLYGCTQNNNKEPSKSMDSTMDSTIPSGMTFLESEEFFDADSPEYFTKNYTVYKDIPNNITENGKSLTLYAVTKFDNQKEYTAYYK